jgi:hypothetical protein
VLSEVAMSLDRTPDRVLRDWREIFEQNAKIIYEEIDYRREARNAQAFADNFRDVPWLRTPQVYPELSSARILTMEYCPGVKVNDVRAIEALGLDRAQLATYAAEAYLLQLLRFGFFHCDPHPGNVAVERIPEDELAAIGKTAGSAEGRIILYDYGMMGTLSPQLKGGLVKGFFAVYEGDAPELAQALFDAELLGADTDRHARSRWPLSARGPPSRAAIACAWTRPPAATPCSSRGRARREQHTAWRGCDPTRSDDSTPPAQSRARARHAQRACAYLVRSHATPRAHRTTAPTPRVAPP